MEILLQIKIGWVHVWIELHHYEIKAIFTSPQINDFSDFIRVAEALAVLAPLANASFHDKIHWDWFLLLDHEKRFKLAKKILKKFFPAWFLFNTYRRFYYQGKTTQISFLKWNCYFANEWFWWENHSLDTLLSRFGFLRLSLH